MTYDSRLVKRLGSINAAIFLCQMYFHMGKEKRPELGIYKSQAEIEDETGLTRREQETARKQLRKLGLLIETYKRWERKLYFRIEVDALLSLVRKLPNAQNRHSGMHETATPECTNPPFVYTESTQRHTTETDTAETHFTTWKKQPQQENGTYASTSTVE